MHNKSTESRCEDAEIVGDEGFLSSLSPFYGHLFRGFVRMQSFTDMPFM